MLDERLADDLKAAMKARDEVAVRTLRMLRTELRYRQDEVRRALKPEEEVACVRSALQRRTDASDQFRAGGRNDLAEAEDAEAGFLRRYLPQQLDAAAIVTEVEAAIAETQAEGPRDFGKVMKAVMGRVAGRADGSTVSGLVRERLNAMA
jgi:hypothetical protein